MSDRGVLTGKAVPVAVKGSVQVAEVVIANGESLSGTVPLGAGARQLVGVIVPNEWTEADLSFAVNADNGTGWHRLKWDDAEYVVALEGIGGDAISLEPSVFAGWPYVRVRSGTAGTPVNQDAARTLVVMTRAV